MTGDERRLFAFACLLIAGAGFLFDLAPTRADPAVSPGAAVPDQALTIVREGYRRYQGVCGHCHGPDGVGSSFAPTLIDPLPPYERFATAVLEGVTGARGVMRGFAGDPNVEPYLDAIYAYLVGGPRGRPSRSRTSQRRACSSPALTLLAPLDRLRP